MAAVAKLWEQGKLDLDKPVQHYVPQWPVKTFNGEEVCLLFVISGLSLEATFKNVNVCILKLTPLATLSKFFF